jgi:hypothetical protein
VNDRERRLGRQNEDTTALLGAVDHLVGAGRPFREDDDVAGLEVALAAGSSEARLSGDDDQPLLAAVFVVIGPRSFPGRQLVETTAEKTAAQASADRSSQVAETVAVALRIPPMVVEQVEDVDALMLCGPNGSVSAACGPAEGADREGGQRRRSAPYDEEAHSGHADVLHSRAITFRFS